MRPGGSGSSSRSASRRSSLAWALLSASLRASAWRALVPPGRPAGAARRAAAAAADPAPGAHRQRLGQQRLRGRAVAQQDQPRRAPLGVELAEERLEQLGRPGVLGVARIVGPVAVVAAAPVEEHLDAGLAAVLRERDHVGIVDRADVDALARGDVRQRLQPVADRRRLLEFEALGASAISAWSWSWIASLRPARNARVCSTRRHSRSRRSGRRRAPCSA